MVLPFVGLRGVEIVERKLIKIKLSFNLTQKEIQFDLIYLDLILVKPIHFILIQVNQIQLIK